MLVNDVSERGEGSDYDKQGSYIALQITQATHIFLRFRASTQPTFEDFESKFQKNSTNIRSFWDAKYSISDGR